MNIEKNCVVQFHYSLKDESGEVLESTEGKDPMAYLHGHKNMIVGLEKQMEGKSEGDKFTAQVEPKDGYGERKEGSTQRIPLKHMHGYRL